MKIIDTYENIFSAYKHNVFDIDLWEKYADEISSELKNKVKKDSKRNDFEKQTLPVLNSLIKNRESAKNAHASFLKVTDNLKQKIFEKFNVDLEVTIVFYLGLCNGAGWATTINGKPAILLGIEKITELNWCDERSMIALIYHELGHIWHFLFEKKKWIPLTAKEKAIRQLYREGIAMTFEQILLGSYDFFHQDIDGWLNWCEENKNSIKTEFLRRINCKESVQDFFGDWCSYKGHSDVGYFLGNRFILDMMKNHSLEEIASFDLKTVYNNFCEYAKK